MITMIQCKNSRNIEASHDNHANHHQERGVIQIMCVSWKFQEITFDSEKYLLNYIHCYGTTQAYHWVDWEEKSEIK